MTTRKPKLVRVRKAGTGGSIKAMPTSLSELKACPENPRQIEPEALAGLTASLDQFGDLSGLVWNKRTGYLVCGHQRKAALEAEHGDGLRLEGGALVTPTGERFPVRVVDWPEEKARAAMVVANNPHVAGDWTAGLAGILEGLEASLGEQFKGLRLDELVADVPVGEPEAGLTDPDAVPVPEYLQIVVLCDTEIRK